MANHWIARGDSVDIITLDGVEAAVAYPLDDTVVLHRLGRSGQSSSFLGGVGRNAKRVAAVRKILDQSAPDVVVSFMDATNVVTLLAGMGLNIPIIVTEHCHPVQFPLGRGWRELRRWTYPRAAALVVLGNEIRDWFAARIPVRRLKIIHNPVLVGTCPARIESSKSIIVSAGRLAEEKQFDKMIEAFGRIASAYPDWRLVIYGEGPKRQELESQIGRAGLTTRVLLPGWVDNLHEHFASADIFAMSSRSEAFPGALCEAMACGLPAVSFDCPSGPAEIVRPGYDGTLVANGDVDELALALEQLMRDEDMRNRYGTHARDVVDRFSLERIMGKWDTLIAEVLKDDRKARRPLSCE